MSEEPRYPNTEGKDLDTQVRELKDYIVNLQRYIRYALNNIDGRNMTKGARVSLGKVGEIEVKVEQTDKGLKTIVGKVNNVETDVQNIKLYKTFVRYSANPDGTNMTETPEDNTAYMGICTVKSETAPEDPEAYDWVAFKGEAGKDGEDAIVLRVDSSRGTAFKNSQIATVLTVTIQKGAKIITDMNTLRKELGIGFSIEWLWQKIDEKEFGVILASDHRISNDGFTFAITPEDVDSKVTFRCRLRKD